MACQRWFCGDSESDESSAPSEYSASSNSPVGAENESQCTAAGRGIPLAPTSVIGAVLAPVAAPQMPAIEVPKANPTHGGRLDQSSHSNIRDAALTDAIRGLDLGIMGRGNLRYVSHRLVDPARRNIFATLFPECTEGDGRMVVAIIAKDNAGDLTELVAAGTNALKLLKCSCQITMEDLSPSECVEYAFAEDPCQWRLGQLSRGALESYRDMKFEAWRKMLLEPTCEAQFRRMLQIGLVTRLFDPHVFPTPDGLRHFYQVTDDQSGRQIQLPHPVAALRTWNVGRRAYDTINPRLTGAPLEAAEPGWWSALLDELGKQHGKDYVAHLDGGVGVPAAR